MTEPTVSTDSPSQPIVRSRFKPLRIWPAILLLIGMFVTRNLPGWWENGPTQLWASAAFGPALCGIMMLLWWLVGSRATWQERLAGFSAIIIAFFASLFAMHPTMHGVAVMVLAIPIGMAAFAIGTIVMSQTLAYKRTIIACLMATAGFFSMSLFKASGMWGNFAVDLTWRSTPTAEEKVAARNNAVPTTPVENNADSAAIDPALLAPEWPGFRGPNRDGIQHGTILPATFSASDIKELWRIPVGPAWSSFVVAGDRLFTQEQRGDQEATVCYNANTGEQIWATTDLGRIDDPLGGPGPRATPTLAGGELYAMGALGRLTKLDPQTGKEIWKKDIKEISGAEVPMWGFSSSPLVINDLVIVYAGGSADFGILACDTKTGDLKWSAPAGIHSYSSPQLANILGEDFILLTTNEGLDFLKSETGEVRFHYEWKHDGYRADQPAVLSQDTIIIPTGMGTGTRSIKLTKNEAGKFTTEELWTTMNMKPDFSDVATFDGYLYGFDNTIFACINLTTGERTWKGGRYGKGQQLLLADSGMIVVATEQGDLKFVKPNPKELTEVVSLKPLNGRTWNHPVVIGNRLYMRNAEEAVCLELPVEKTKPEVAVATP